MRQIIQSRQALLPAAAIVLTVIVVACVTINVYFPEAAAERAADRFIQDVIGPEVPTGESASHTPQVRRGLASIVAGLLISPAHAQAADIDVETPQINAIKQRMAERHRQHLASWYEAGAIGFDNDGLVEIRDRSAVGLSERRELEQVVSAENADRRAVYREIALANQQPEWEDRIRQTFAERWIANARPGWYYQDDSGNWQRK
ncbi:MAG: YdbL family protein [Xanthomonadaceae bacterium]|nr:YdbL family protein [Xanthomonadaceae bacterium]